MAVRKRKAEGGIPVEGRDNVIEAPIVPRRLTVSEILRDRRLECSLDIEHVAQVLRIRPAVLTAIEAGEIDQLPGPAYAVGFVRSYATYLGLDAEALVLRFKAEVAEVSRKPHLNFPLPVSDSRVPTRPILLICILLAILTYAGWYYVSSDHRNIADLVPAVPERLRHLLSPDQVKQEITAGADHPTAPQQAEPPATTAPQIPAQSAGQPAVSAAPAATPQQTGGQQTVPAAPPLASAPAAETDGVPPVEERPNAPATAAPATPDLAQPTVSEGGKTQAQSAYGAPDGQARIVLHAVADSWIQVRDSQGNLLITRVLKPGESYNVPNQPGLTMVTGNAGGLDIAVDGMNIPRLGESGRVARNVTLDPARLLAGKTHAN